MEMLKAAGSRKVVGTKQGLRAVRAGTVEFPSFPVSWFDLSSRAYKTMRTESIPIQVRAGAQAALGALDETGDEADTMPMPDGIDLDPSLLHNQNEEK